MSLICFIETEKQIQVNFIKNQNINNRLNMVKIQFLETEFELDMEGLEEFEAFKKKLRIPYTSIKNVEDTAGDVFGKFKIMGTRLTQNSHDYGSFTTDEGEGFFAYKTRENAFAIHLTNNQYGIIIIELENREQVIDELRSRMGKI